MKFETIKDNKKRIGVTIGIVGIILVIGVTAFTLTRANYKQTQSVPLIKGNISYNKSDLEIVAIKLKDGSTYTDSDVVPTSGYVLNENESICKDKSGNKIETTFEYSNGKINVLVTKRGTKCTLVFDKVTLTPIATALISKNQMANDYGYRYQGSNPNNYVTFNNELWRIIGAFDVVNGDTNKTERLVKIIRYDSIGNMYWDTEGEKGLNDWSKSDLKTILNGQYYNGENINYTYKNYSKGEENISGKSINDASRKMIQNVKWYLGSAPNEEYVISEFYDFERGTVGGKAHPSLIEWTGNVGLMYVSDYGLAVGETVCSRDEYVNYYDRTECKNNNWLFNSNDQWTITPYRSSVDYVFAMSKSGFVDWLQISGLKSVYPTVYLKSTVQLVNNGKDGSQSKPYDLILN